MPIIQPINICEDKIIDNKYPPSWHGTFNITLNEDFGEFGGPGGLEVNLIKDYGKDKYSDVVFRCGPYILPRRTIEVGEQIQVVNEAQCNFMYYHTTDDEDDDGKTDGKRDGKNLIKDLTTISKQLSNDATVYFVFKKNQLEAAGAKPKWRDDFTNKEKSDGTIEVTLGSTSITSKWDLDHWKRDKQYNINDRVRVGYYSYTCMKPNTGTPPGRASDCWGPGLLFSKSRSLNVDHINKRFQKLSQYFKVFNALLPNSKLRIQNINKVIGAVNLTILEPVMQFKVKKCKPGEDNQEFEIQYPINQYPISEFKFGNAIIIKIGGYSFNTLFDWSLNYGGEIDQFAFFTSFYTKINTAFVEGSLQNLQGSYYGIEDIDSNELNRYRYHLYAKPEQRDPYTSSVPVDNLIWRAISEYIDNAIESLQMNVFEIDDDTKEIWIDLIRIFSPDHKYDETATYNICLNEIWSLEPIIIPDINLIDTLNKTPNYSTKGTTWNILNREQVIYVGRTPE